MIAEGASITGGRLDDAQRLAWLRLIRSENVGPVAFRGLVNRFGGAQAALDALPDLARRGGLRRSIRVCPQADAEAEFGRAEKLGARFLFRGEPDYPPLLLATEAAPPVLAAMGDPAVFARTSVAIVGARNASAAGAKFARNLAVDLGAAGIVVVSGLARGIDTAAHEGALATGTVGVFAGGLDRPYPRENTGLMRRIVDGAGCLVSEMPFGWEPRAVDFPRRNRVVAALSIGLVVVEAAARSGSLISARLAGELGRLVFAVPGSPLDPRASGTNRLLKDGATIVTEAADVVDALAPLAPGGRAPFADAREPDVGVPDSMAQTGERERVLDALGPVPTLPDDLASHASVSIGCLLAVLLELDLAGRLERHPGGLVSLN